MSEPLTNPWLHRFAMLTALATFLLLAAGGLVTSHGAGMAVPDWPNTYGYNLFLFPVSKWVGGIFYEHTHRLIASGVGVLTTLLALWLYGRNARPVMRWTGLALLMLGIADALAFPGRRADGAVTGIAGLALLGASFVWPRCAPAAGWLRRLGVIAFIAVVLQGVLGGLRVVLFKDPIGIFHATLAQLFFALVCAIALFTGKGWRNLPRSAVAISDRRPVSQTNLRKAGKLRQLAVATTALILFQLILGATMRHQHAGLAIPDFPLAYGKLWPATDPESVAHYNERRVEITAANPITAFQIELQMAHRMAAALILAAVMGCAWSASRNFTWRSPLTRLAMFWLGLIVAQAGLGAATVWSDKAADIATAHVLVGALSLATGAIWCIISFQSPESARRGPVLSGATANARNGGALEVEAAAAQES